MDNGVVNSILGKLEDFSRRISKKDAQVMELQRKVVVLEERMVVLSALVEGVIES